MLTQLGPFDHITIDETIFLIMKLNIDTLHFTNPDVDICICNAQYSFINQHVIYIAQYDSLCHHNIS